MGIPSGITSGDVLRAIRDLDRGIHHRFGESTEYDLLYEGRRYPPKAVVGLAARRVLGRVLKREEFSGGEGSGQANSALRSPGFEVVPK